MNLKKIIILLLLIPLCFSCKKKVKGIKTKNQHSNIDTIINSNNKYHHRSVTIEELQTDSLKHINYSFKLKTKDTIIKNIFTSKDVSTELIKSIQIYIDTKLIQEIKDINEVALYYPENQKKGLIKLEDKNKDGFLDLWLEFSPYSRQYDSDFIIFLFNEKENLFSNKRKYLLKNLTEEDFLKKYGSEKNN